MKNLIQFIEENKYSIPEGFYCIELTGRVAYQKDNKESSIYNRSFLAGHVCPFLYVDQKTKEERCGLNQMRLYDKVKKCNINDKIPEEEVEIIYEQEDGNFIHFDKVESIWQ